MQCNVLKASANASNAMRTKAVESFDGYGCLNSLCIQVPILVLPLMASPEINICHRLTLNLISTKSHLLELLGHSLGPILVLV